MKKIYYLKTCDTCKRIIKELNITKDNFEFQNIKENHVNEKQLNEIKKLSNLSYEELFNKRSQKYKLVKEKIKTEDDFKKAILSEYTFIKRPIIIINKNISVGNSKKEIEKIKDLID